MKKGCVGDVYAPTADATAGVELAIQNRLPKGSFGPIHACVLIDDHPVAALADVTSRTIASGTALHLVTKVKPGRHVVRVLVEAPGIAEWSGYSFDPSSTHEIVTEIPVHAAVTVFGKNAESPRDMIQFEWQDDSVPAPTGAEILRTGAP